MPLHWVEFRRGFWIGRTEVTNAQYARFDPKYPRSEESRGDQHPMVNVSWQDAKRYCAWLSEQAGREIRLPSESEWECACRAGSPHEYCFGDEQGRLAEYAWFHDSLDPCADVVAHQVATKRPNSWDLYDLHGNVWEWCEDAGGTRYSDSHGDGSMWTVVGDFLKRRSIRGGSWGGSAEACRSAYRHSCPLWYRDSDLGFRPAFVTAAP